MEKSRDLVKDGKVTQYEIKLQDWGISLENDDPVDIGAKVLENQHLGESRGRVSAFEMNKTGQKTNSDYGDLRSTKMSGLKDTMYRQADEPPVSLPKSAQKQRSAQ